MSSTAGVMTLDHLSKQELLFYLGLVIGKYDVKILSELLMLNPAEFPESTIAAQFMQSLDTQTQTIVRKYDLENPLRKQFKSFITAMFFSVCHCTSTKMLNRVSPPFRKTGSSNAVWGFQDKQNPELNVYTLVYMVTFPN